MKRPEPTHQERTFSANEIIVSKTDPKGRPTYVNNVFCSVGLYEEAEVIGQPQSIARHPDMPRTVFAMLWEPIQAGAEIFACVKNMSKNGEFYWVLARVTPCFDLEGRLEGYHSNRRLPSRKALDLEQISTAGGSMDEMTQRNGALAEQTSAAALALQQQAEHLAQLVSFFQTGGGRSGK